MLLNCKGKLREFHRAVIMGIINITPDSFYRGYLGEPESVILQRVQKMVDAGVEMIDVGGQSTRPGSLRIDADEELTRVLPVVTALCERFPDLIISIDTYHAVVAKKAVEAGASIINDISGGEMDPDMIPTAASLRVPYICMHMQGSPETMQESPGYENLLTDILDFFVLKLEACRKAGIHDVILDPGFGFGKTIDHNFHLLRNLEAFRLLKSPILVGLSRKSTVYKTLNVSPDEALNGTTVLNTLALLNGADILRVHDVDEARQAITLVERYKKAAPVTGAALNPS